MVPKRDRGEEEEGVTASHLTARMCMGCDRLRLPCDESEDEEEEDEGSGERWGGPCLARGAAAVGW